MTEEMKNKLKEYATRGDDTEDSKGYDLQMVSNVHWYLDNVWHDSNKEQPRKGGTVVVTDGYSGEVLTRCMEVYPNRWWAYLDDLFNRKK